MMMLKEVIPELTSALSDINIEVSNLLKRSKMAIKILMELKQQLLVKQTLVSLLCLMHY